MKSQQKNISIPSAMSNFFGCNARATDIYSVELLPENAAKLMKRATSDPALVTLMKVVAPKGKLIDVLRLNDREALLLVLRYRPGICAIPCYFRSYLVTADRELVEQVMDRVFD